MREHYPGVTIDWLVSEATSWPPPDADSRMQLTSDEAEIVRYLRQFHADDDGLKDAKQRLALRGKYEPRQDVVGQGQAEYDREKAQEEAKGKIDGKTKTGRGRRGA